MLLRLLGLCLLRLLLRLLSQLPCFTIIIILNRNLICLLHYSPSSLPDNLKLASSVFIPFSYLHDIPAAAAASASPESLADIASAAQPSPPAFTPSRGSAVQFLHDLLASQEEEFSGLYEAFIKGKAQLDFLQEQVLVLVSPQDVPRTDGDATRRELMSEDAKIFSLCSTVRLSQAFVAEVTSPCDTLHSEISARTLKVAALRACLPVVASGPSQSDHDAVFWQSDGFASILHFSDHTGRLDDYLFDLFD